MSGIDLASQNINVQAIRNCTDSIQLEKSFLDIFLIPFKNVKITLNVNSKDNVYQVDNTKHHNLEKVGVSLVIFAMTAFIRSSVCKLHEFH